MEPLRGYVAVFQNDFPFDLVNKMRYILWMAALLEACDVTNNGRHPSCHHVFYQELEISLKPQEIVIFCALYEK